MLDTEISSAAVALDNAIKIAGGKSALARALGVPRQNIQVWTRVPAHHVAAVEAVTGISRHILRPDLSEIFRRESF